MFGSVSEVVDMFLTSEVVFAVPSDQLVNKPTFYKPSMLSPGAKTSIMEKYFCVFSFMLNGAIGKIWPVLYMYFTYYNK